MFEIKEKLNNCQELSFKGDLFLSNAKIIEVQPIVWPKNEGLLRQALLNSPEKDLKFSEEKMLPLIIDLCDSESRKRRSSDIVETIQLTYASGGDNSEYTSQILSQLTSSTLPTITCSQVSSVLSALEPNSVYGIIPQTVTSSYHEETGKDKESKKTKDKETSKEAIINSRMERRHYNKKMWYHCLQCEFLCLDREKANCHAEKCTGAVKKLCCIACNNSFKSTAILQAHLLIDHNVAMAELPELISLHLETAKQITNDKTVIQKGNRNPEDNNCDLQKIPNSLLTQTSCLPPTPGFSLFETVEKYISDATDNTQESHENNLEVKREKGGKVAKKPLKNPPSVKIEKETGLRCGVDGCAVRLVSHSNMDYHRQCHDGVKWKCVECRVNSSSWANLSIHLWKQHSIDMELFSCDQCSYKTNSLSKLMNLHRRTHGEERPFLCDSCGKGFKTTKQLRNHKTVHKSKQKGENDNSITCTICGRTFACLRMLRHHTDIVHRKIRPYLCSDCGHSAASRSSLRMHSRQHTGEKPYRCTECEYCTSDHNTLRRHKMRHTGAKHYTCPHCPYACIQSSTFKSHLKNKHPGLDEGLMFSCEVCPFRTVRKDNFLAHASYHSLKISDIDLSKDSEVDLHEYRNLTKEVSASILPSGRSFMTEDVDGRLKAEQILSREQDPLLMQNHDEDTDIMDGSD